MKLVKSLLGKLLKLIFLPPPTSKQKNISVLFYKEKSLGYLAVYADLKRKRATCQSKSVRCVVQKPQGKTSLMFKHHSITCPEIRVCVIFFLASTSVLKTRD